MKLPPDTIISDGRGHTRRILWPSPSPPPLVTAVVPTRDRLDLLTQCLTGLCATQYPALEIVIVDNDSEQPETLAYFEKVQQQGIKVLHYDGPFNFAAMNNAAAAMASGEYLCLINNDIEFVDPTWLTTMVRQAARHHVGAVGAKLLFPDFTLQHAGVAIGLGGAAGHMHKHMPETSDACHNEPHVQRAVSAVTAACLLLSKRKFLEVGGFDAEAFAVAFNDVDLCLKLQRAGYTNIYEPFALAVHHESQSRGDDLSHVNLPRYLKELSALQQRWNTKCATDPNWHPNFVYSCEQKVLHV